MGPHGEAPAGPWDLSLWVPQRALDQQRGAGQDRLHAPGQAGGTSARLSTGDHRTGAHILDPNTGIDPDKIAATRACSEARPPKRGRNTRVEAPTAV